jgi:carbamoyltransferase
VSKEENEIYYELINDFYKLTGVPCVLNTSFNLKDEPLVETPEQAVFDFMRTNMDYLVVGNYFCSKV